MNTSETQQINYIFDAEFSGKHINDYLPEYFASITGQYIFNQVQGTYNNYGYIPTPESILNGIDGAKGLSEYDRQEIVETLKSINDDKSSYQFKVDAAKKYINNVQAFSYASTIIEAQSSGETDFSHYHEQYDSRRVFNEDTTESFDDAFWEFINDDEIKIPFKLNQFNEATNGGLCRQQLAVLIAPSNVGKTMVMCSLMMDYIRNGFKVLYITLEDLVMNIKSRCASNILSMTTNELRSATDSQKAAVNKLSSRFRVDRLPTGMGTTSDIKSIIRSLKASGFVPDIVFVDYIGLMDSPRAKYANDTYMKGKLVAEDLRALADSEDILLWTAAQSQRAAGKQVIGNDDIGESKAIVDTADFVAGITQTESDIAMSQITFNVSKIRNGGSKKSFQVPVEIKHQRIGNKQEVKEKPKDISNIKWN